MTNMKFLNDTIETHFQISGKIVNIVRRLRIRTIGDLCEFNIQSFDHIKGIGTKKAEEFKSLINNAKKLCGFEILPEYPPGIDLSGTIFKPNSPLLYVPSILKVVFDKHGIRTVGDLITFNLSDTDNMQGLGDKKKAALFGTRELYTRLATIKDFAQILFVDELVPNQVLPTKKIGRMRLAKFLSGQNGDAWDGKALQEATELRILLNTVIFPKGDIVDVDDLEWAEIPLRVIAKIRRIAESYNLRTVGQLSEFAKDGFFVDPISQERINIEQDNNLGKTYLKTLRKEVSKLKVLGLEQYQFGKIGAPGTLKDCIARALNYLNPRELEIIRRRCCGSFLIDLAKQYSVSRERIRQIENTIIRSLKIYRMTAKNLLAKMADRLPINLFWNADEIRTRLGLDLQWHFDFLLELTEIDHERFDSKTISRIPVKHVDILRTALRKLTKNRRMLSLRNLASVDLVLQKFRKLFPIDYPSIALLEKYSNCILSMGDLRTLLGDRWLSVSIRSQIVNSGVNGIEFKDIDTGGFFPTPGELEILLGRRAERLEGDIFRKRADSCNRADEIEKIAREASGPFDLEYLLLRSKYKWDKAVLIMTCLSPQFKIVNVEHGLYIHITKLGLTVADVKQIANWGEILLRGNNLPIDGANMFTLFKSSNFPQKIQNARQLVSILAKHPEVRRLLYGLKLAHSASLDERALSLAHTHPEIAALWHPIKNRSLTPKDVRPNSNKLLWWKCNKGHEFKTTPGIITHWKSTCPKCKA